MTWLGALMATGCAHFQPRVVDPAETEARLCARSLTNREVVAFVQAHGPAGEGEALPDSWTLDELTLAGLYFDPALEVARRHWEAAAGSIRTANQRPNPVLSVIPGYNFSPASGLGAPVSPWFPAINLDVPLETAGKRRIRRAQAESGAEQARWEWVEAAWRVREAVRSALISVSYAEARVAALKEQSDLQAQLAASEDERLAAGATDRLESSRRRMAADQAMLDLEEGRRQAGVARSRLAGALGIPVEGLLHANVRFDLLSVPPVAMEGTDAIGPLRDVALRGRADILAALAGYAVSQARLQLEIARQYPDVRLGSGYQYDQGDHKWSLALSVELPILNQNQGPIAEAQAGRERAAAQFTAVQATALAQLDEAWTGFRLARSSFEAAQGLESSRTATERAAAEWFSTGAMDRRDWLLARLELNAARLARLDLAVQAQRAAGALESAVQRPFAGLGRIIAEGSSLAPTS